MATRQGYEVVRPNRVQIRSEKQEKKSSWVRRALSTPLAIIDLEMNEVASLQSKVEVWGNGGLKDQFQGDNANILQNCHKNCSSWVTDFDDSGDPARAERWLKHTGRCFELAGLTEVEKVVFVRYFLRAG